MIMLKHLLKEIENSEDYRGTHKAPDKSNGSPLYNVTQAAYPDDIYTLNIPTAARYYGDSSGNDTESISIIKYAHNKPNAQIKIYRAVPNLNKDIDKKIKSYREILSYLHTYGFLPMKNPRSSTLNDKFKYDKTQISNYIESEINKLTATKNKPISLNAGDWVTINKNYAKQHGESTLLGNYKILSKLVPAKFLFTDGNSIHEWGYDPS